MNKQQIVICAIAVGMLSGCYSKFADLEGTWKVNNRAYSATYQLNESRSGLNCRVLRYDDGTTQFTADEGIEKFLFRDLKQIDGTTGATLLAKQAPNLKLELVHPDTLVFTLSVMHKPISEKWIRVKLNEHE